MEIDIHGEATNLGKQLCVAAVAIVMTMIGCGGSMDAQQCAANPDECLAHYYDQAAEECIPKARGAFVDDFQWLNNETKDNPFTAGSVEARIPASAGQGYKTRTQVGYIGQIGTGFSRLSPSPDLTEVYVFCNYALRDSDFEFGAAVLRDKQEHAHFMATNELTQWRGIVRGDNSSTSPPTPVPTVTPVSRSGMGANRQVIEDFFTREAGFDFELIPHVEGFRQSLGYGLNGSVHIELRGPDNDLYRATIDGFILPSSTDAEVSTIAAYFLEFVYLVAPEWELGGEWLNTAISRAVDSGEPQATIHENKRVYVIVNRGVNDSLHLSLEISSAERK